MTLQLVDKQWQQGQRMVIYGAVFLITTLLILYSSSSSPDLSRSFKTSNIRQIHHTLKTTNLKKWAGKDGYLPVYGNKSLTLHCHHCALVTSSSHVLGSQAGEEIDRTQCVFRMNNAPTSGYQSDVGNRTTVRVVAHSSVFSVVRKPAEFLNRSENPIIIFWGPSSKISREAKGTLYRLIQRVSMSYRNLSFFFISPSKMQKFDALFQKETGRDRKKSQSWLSTGWFTMVIAIEMCDNIKVYGMVPPNYCGRRPQPKRMPYHYYKPRGPDECVTYLQNERGLRGSHHRFITEKQVFARWAKLYNISYTSPTW